MIDNHRMGAALRLAAFSRIVDDERIDQGKIAQQEIRKTFAGKADAFARQPLERAMLAHVHDDIRAPSAFIPRCPEPSIESSVLMGGGKVRSVINGVRID